MADPTKEKPKGEAAIEDANSLGISKGIYAAGHALKDGLIWGTIATVISYVVLAMGRKPEIREAGKIIQESNFIDKAARVLEDGHKAFKKWLGDSVQSIAKMFGKKIDTEHATGSAITATALVAGGVVGHIAQGPAAHKGWKQAQQLDAKYENMRLENERLKGENKIMADDLERLNKGLAEVKRPDPSADKDAAAARTV